ncbi:jg13088 [Pararge aegeria aegeria]|uniref:Jg13088 protein n=2 Tax=Pararge aegeria TaxID=116150 RepID=A0A8S4RMK2_9NEOP|nr:jg13088 [Pararge aegeria aegeria]
MKKRKMDYPTDKQLTLQRKETTPVDFTRLLVMRVVYGLAKVMGFQEPVSELLNGALVPPGADDDDDFDDDDDDGLFDDY